MIKNNCYILTGAPGSGKSAIIDEIKKDTHCVNEFAREVIAEQRAIQGDGLYDKNPLLFKELMLSRAINDFINAEDQKITLFDRGIPDLLAYSDCFNLTRGAEVNATNIYRYNHKVFFAPSWEEIYSNDEDRKISFSEAKLFGENLKSIYMSQNYEVIELPYDSVEVRLDFITKHLGL